jgi:hypothetical protein
MASHESGWKNAVHRRQWTQTLRDHAYPTLAKVSVNAITTEHVLAVLSPLWATKSETAARLRGRIASILDAERVAGHRSGENPARWNGHLQHLLPARPKVRKGGKHPACPWQLAPAFMQQLRGMPGIGRASHVRSLIARL